MNTRLSLKPTRHYWHVRAKTERGLTSRMRMRMA